MLIRRSIVFLMIFSLLSANCTRFFLLAGFQLNRQYIADKLCINKARPWIHCNGRCYFMKKVHQAEEAEKKQEAKDNLNRLELSLYQQDLSAALSLPPATTLENVLNSFYHFDYSGRYTGFIFRPPQTIA